MSDPKKLSRQRRFYWSKKVKSLGIPVPIGGLSDIQLKELYKTLTEERRLKEVVKEIDKTLESKRDDEKKISSTFADRGVSEQEFYQIRRGEPLTRDKIEENILSARLTEIENDIKFNSIYPTREELREFSKKDQLRLLNMIPTEPESPLIHDKGDAIIIPTDIAFNPNIDLSIYVREQDRLKREEEKSKRKVWNFD